MDDWVKTVATPGNISILTSISWKLGNDRYFIRSGSSDKNTTPIYYNPESGHLAQYNPVSGLLSCMYSQVNSYNWNWVKWSLCSDAPISKNNPAYWNVYLETEEGGMITDYQGNALRVTRYGSNWGVAYAAKLSYLKKDTTHSPTSLFFVDRDLLNWARYTASNLGKTEQYCPAGKKEHYNITIKRTLPPGFQLTEEWIRRLYDITNSTLSVGEVQIRGICGVCLLHTFQMLAELQEYHSHGPIQGGGYFFDTAPNRDPFDSFRQRYPELDTLLVDVPNVYGSTAGTTRLLTLASARIMLPQYEWTLSREFTTRSEILSHVRSLIGSSPGNVWLALMLRYSPDARTLIWHAVPILRTSQGLVVIPTNWSSLPFNVYRRYLTPTTDPFQVISNLERPGRTLLRFITIRLDQVYRNIFDFMISNRDCTGEGGDRRGTGRYPTSTLVNQCSGGRCTLM
ncbi:PF07598 family protein [Leptospira kirschneri str. JB]|nr:PF07598 family protein [Leptospira kirschneri str. JB]